MSTPSDDTASWIRTLDLMPHPEGGYYRETFRSPEIVPTPRGPRPACTSILYVLPPKGMSVFHRVRSDEVWNHHQGGPVALTTLLPSGEVRAVVLGPDIDRHQVPQATVPAGAWQAARNPSDRPALCGCTVAPGFDFADFEIANIHALIEAWPQHEALIRALTR